MVPASMLVAAALGLNATGCIIVMTQGVAGSGRILEQVRPVGPFTAVRVSGNLRANVTLGEPASVRIAADDNLLPLVRAEVVDGWLVVQPVQGVTLHSAKGVVATVVTPVLAALDASGGGRIEAVAGPTQTFKIEASGGGEVEVKGLAADDLTVEASGGAEVTVAGTAKKVSLEMSGGVEVSGVDLTAEDVRLDGSGGCNARIRASGAVTGSLSGGCDVAVYGNPPRSRVSTSGGSGVDYKD